MPDMQICIQLIYAYAGVYIHTLPFPFLLSQSLIIFVQSSLLLIPLQIATFMIVAKLTVAAMDNSTALKSTSMMVAIVVYYSRSIGITIAITTAIVIITIVITISSTTTTTTTTTTSYDDDSTSTSVLL